MKFQSSSTLNKLLSGYLNYIWIVSSILIDIRDHKIDRRSASLFYTIGYVYVYCVPGKNFIC